MRAHLATALLAVSLGVTACSGDEPDDALPTLPPVTASPSPSAVAVPGEAAEATPEGAAEFARFFYESVEAAFKSRDSSTLVELSAPDCDVCQRYINSVNTLAERNERVEGYEISVQDTASPGNPQQTTVVTVIYDSTAARRVDAAGRPVREEPARTTVVSDLVIRRSGDGWLVEQVQAK